MSDSLESSIKEIERALVIREAPRACYDLVCGNVLDRQFLRNSFRLRKNGEAFANACVMVYIKYHPNRLEETYSFVFTKLSLGAIICLQEVSEDLRVIFSKRLPSNHFFFHDGKIIIIPLGLSFIERHIVHGFPVCEIGLMGNDAHNFVLCSMHINWNVKDKAVHIQDVLNEVYIHFGTDAKVVFAGDMNEIPENLQGVNPIDECDHTSLYIAKGIPGVIDHFIGLNITFLSNTTVRLPCNWPLLITDEIDGQFTTSEDGSVILNQFVIDRIKALGFSDHAAISVIIAV